MRSRYFSSIEDQIIQLSIIKLQEMQGRQTEPNLLTIEAIIQKSEFASKALERVPDDFKKLFINQMLKDKTALSDPRRNSKYFQLYENNKKSQHKVMHIPPLPKKQKNSSLNNSKEKKQHHQKHESIKTTRSVKNTVKNSLQVMVRKNSFTNKTQINRNTISAEGIQRQKIKPELITLDEENSEQKVLVRNKSEKNRVQSKRQIPGPIKINKFSYDFQIPQNPKTSKQMNRSDQKPTKQSINQSSFCMNQNPQTQKFKQQMKSTQTNEKNLVTLEKQQKSISFCKKKLKTSLEVIPNFVMAAISEQIKIEDRKVEKEQNAEKKQKQITQFSFDNCNQNIAKETWEVKPSNCVKQMKKLIQFHKTRRTDESIDDLLEPRVENMKLLQKIEKSSAEEKNDNEKVSKRKSLSYQKPRKKKKVVEEDVCGWEVNDGPMFQDYY